MRHRQTLRKRLRTAAVWPLGIALTSWRYFWRLTPVDRWEWSDSEPEDEAPPLPEGADLLRSDDGTGPLIYRLYRLRMRESTLDAQALMSAITADLDQVAPSEFARFQKVLGDEDRLQVGDEYVVRMPGPWDGPVRVVEVTPSAFRLATLTGHLEAGQIQFSACAHDGALVFTIESWARSSDWLSDLLYAHLRIAKEVQLHMWVSVLQRVCDLSGGRRHGPLTVVTRQIEDQGEGGDSTLIGPQNRYAQRKLRQLAGRSLNFDAEVVARREDGWHVDHLSRSLPGEAPGSPEPAGTWAIARRLMIDYQVADPATVRATYRRGSPLAGRDMLLQIRFVGVRFYVGVRVDGAYDETRTVAGREARVFGWSYSTLEGHFEQGRMHYEVWKWLDDGTVEFRVSAFSRKADAGPRLLRAGFSVVGRTNQLTFYHRAARRIVRFTEAQLELSRARAGG